MTMPRTIAMTMTMTMTMTSQRGLQAACSAVAIASFAAICASSAGLVRQIAGLCLIGAFAFALWFMQGFMRRGRFDAIVPAIGLTVAFLILAGLALAAVHALETVPVALALTVATLAVVWAGASRPVTSPPATSPPVSRPTAALAERRAWLKPLHPLAVIGILIFAATTVLAVRHSATSATADADGASSVAIWAYPSGGQLHFGVEQPAGHGATSLQIVVSQAGVTVAMWTDVHLAPGQTWEAPALTVTGDGPDQVVALHDGTVVASLSSR
jgi:hypothetical protein